MNKKYLVLFASALALIGCSDATKKTKRNIEEVDAKISEQFREFKDANTGAVVDAGRPYFGEAIDKSSLRSELSVPFAEGLDGDDGIRISLRRASLREASDLIQLTTGIIVNINSSAGASSDSDEEDSLAPVRTRISINYSGSLSAFLDQIAARTDTSWRYDGVSINFDRMQLKTYSLPLLPFGMSASSSVSATGQGGDAGGASVSLSGSMEFDPWAELEARITAIAPDPSTILISKGLAKIDVLAPPSVHRRVRELVAEVSELYEKTIQIDVAVYFVNANAIDDFKAGLGLSKDGLSFTGPSGNAVAGNAVVALDKTLGGAAVDAQLQALATDASVVDSFFGSTRVQPGIIVPLVTTESTAYVSGTSVTTTGDTTTTAISTSTIDAGISLFSVAQITPDGDIVVDTTVSQSSIKEIKQFTSGTSTTQLPETTNRVVRGAGVVRSGGWLVLAGYEQDFNSTSDTGTGRPKFKLLGGSKRSETKRVRMFVVVRPTIIGK